MDVFIAILWPAAEEIAALLQQAGHTGPDTARRAWQNSKLSDWGSPRARCPADERKRLEFRERLGLNTLLRILALVYACPLEMRLMGDESTRLEPDKNCAKVATTIASNLSKHG